MARALSVRGLATEVVEGGDHLLRSQVGAEAGAVLARDLARLGTTVYTGARAVRLTDEGLRLDNGYTLETDLVVLTAGGRPSTALARRAGLERAPRRRRRRPPAHHATRASTRSATAPQHGRR